MFKDNVRFFCFIVMTSCIGQMAAEIYLPSLPYISKDFQASSNLVQLSISCFLLGMALPGIILGYLSDQLGRRKILLISAIISLCGTFLCFSAPNITILIIGRTLQGVGFSGVAGSSRAILRDKLQGIELARYLAYLGMAIALSIDLAPFVGGILQQFTGWRIIFLLLLFLNLIIIYSAYRFKEQALTSTTKLRWQDLFSGLKYVFTDKNFLRYNFIGAICYASFMAYLSITSFIVQDLFAKSPAWFGSMALLLALIFIATCFINARALNKFSQVILIKFGFWVIMLSSALLISGAFMHKISLVFFISAILPLYIGSAFIMTNSEALAFTQINKSIGIAAATYYSIRLFLGMLITALISLFNPLSTLPLGSIFASLTAIALLLIYTAPKQVK